MALSYHRICDFKEACDICAQHVVPRLTEELGRLIRSGVDVHHDLVELFIDLFCAGSQHNPRLVPSLHKTACRSN